jgi:hypothetical protein
LQQYQLLLAEIECMFSTLFSIKERYATGATDDFCNFDNHGGRLAFMSLWEAPMAGAA